MNNSFNTDFKELEARMTASMSPEELKQLRKRMKVATYCQLYGGSSDLVRDCSRASTVREDGH